MDKIEYIDEQVEQQESLKPKDDVKVIVPTFSGRSSLFNPGNTSMGPHYFLHQMQELQCGGNVMFVDVSGYGGGFLNPFHPQIMIPDGYTDIKFAVEETMPAGTEYLGPLLPHHIVTNIIPALFEQKFGIKMSAEVLSPWLTSGVAVGRLLMHLEAHTASGPVIFTDDDMGAPLYVATGADMSSDTLWQTMHLTNIVLASQLLKLAPELGFGNTLEGLLKLLGSTIGGTEYGLPKGTDSAIHYPNQPVDMPIVQSGSVQTQVHAAVVGPIANAADIHLGAAMNAGHFDPTVGWLDGKTYVILPEGGGKTVLINQWGDSTLAYSGFSSEVSSWLLMPPFPVPRSQDMSFRWAIQQYGPIGMVVKPPVGHHRFHSGRSPHFALVEMLCAKTANLHYQALYKVMKEDGPDQELLASMIKELLDTNDLRSCLNALGFQGGTNDVVKFIREHYPEGFDGIQSKGEIKTAASNYWGGHLLAFLIVLSVWEELIEWYGKNKQGLAIKVTK